MRIGNQATAPKFDDYHYQNNVEKPRMNDSDDLKLSDDTNSDRLVLSDLKKKPEYAKTPYEKEEQKKLEKLALSGNSRLDPDQYDMVKQLELIERGVIMHEKAHQAAGGASVGAASYQYTMGPDYRYYATGGSVEYKLPFAGTPESMLRAFRGLKNSANAVGDSSGQDHKMAAMAEAKIQDIKNKVASQRGKLAYYEQMIKSKYNKKSKNLN